ncbi:sensor histidine kinase [Piscinibacter terrae]|uniref:histidine kinase n=1 Tax=Piscinibacter terrae TaxID=2496871 RepID=A0A3N7HIJ9_9BURK|nr:HAMP domain-containing sensor histidine kinase [Albitalea terrae]RQP21313.1 sensor histidine kinase [Albitalea terrae]
MSKAQAPRGLHGISPSGSPFHFSEFDDEGCHAAGLDAGQKALLDTMRQGHARLAAQAAHELMAPLAAQRMAAEAALRDGAALEHLENAVVAMLEEGRRMQQLIDDLLLMAQADGGMLGTPHTIIDACGVAAEAVQCIEPLAETRKQCLALHVHGFQFIKADAAVLRQVLLNLIHDTTAHAPTGSRIVISVTASTLGEVEISVVRDGTGPECRDPISAPPQGQPWPGNRSGRVSTGLGLAIAKSLVRSQGGTCAVASTPGRGTAVRLGFPACEAPLPEGEPPRWKRRASDR